MNPDDAPSEISPAAGPANVNWQAPEYSTWPKTRQWFTVVWIIAAAVSVTFALLYFLFGAILIYGALVVILSAFVLTSEARRAPRQITYAIRDKILVIDGEQHALTEYKTFSVREEPNEMVRIYLVADKRFGFPIVLTARANDADQIMGALSAYIPPGETLTVTIADTLARLTGLI